MANVSGLSYMCFSRPSFMRTLKFLHVTAIFRFRKEVRRDLVSRWQLQALRSETLLQHFTRPLGQSKKCSLMTDRRQMYLLMKVVCRSGYLGHRCWQGHRRTASARRAQGHSTTAGTRTEADFTQLTQATVSQVSASCVNRVCRHYVRAVRVPDAFRSEC